MTALVMALIVASFDTILEQTGSSKLVNTKRGGAPLGNHAAFRTKPLGDAQLATG